MVSLEVVRDAYNAASIKVHVSLGGCDPCYAELVSFFLVSVTP